MGDKLQPEQIAGSSPTSCREECTLTHEIFSVGGGRIARVFVGLAGLGQGRRRDADDRGGSRQHRADHGHRGLHDPDERAGRADGARPVPGGLERDADRVRRRVGAELPAARARGARTT